MDNDSSSLVRLLMDERFRMWVHHPNPMLDRYWKQRIGDDPEAQRTVAQARQMLRHLDFPKNERIDREGILEKVLARAEEQAAQPPVTIPATRPRSHRWPYWAVAATLVGVLFAVSFWFFQPDVQTFETAYGESQTILLPDSSTVILNANSTLRFTNNWEEAHARQVELEGEAFFSVTHQANDQKFIVAAHGLAIEVLGTEFNVNHRSDQTEVVLKQGSIRLGWSTDSVVQDTARNMMVKPGERVVFSGRNPPVKNQVNPDVYSSWTDDRWLFEQTPLSEVFAMIENNYGYRVVAQPASIADELFTAEIRHTDLNLLLTFLSESFALDITQRESSITIKERATKQ